MFNILTKPILWMQFWVNNVYRLKVKIYLLYLLKGKYGLEKFYFY